MAASSTAPALRSAIVLGLVLTFVLGASAGIVLSGLPAVSNAGGLPVVGWSLRRRRPAPGALRRHPCRPGDPGVRCLARLAPHGRGAGDAARCGCFAAAVDALFAAACFLAFVQMPMLAG